MQLLSSVLWSILLSFCTTLGASACLTFNAVASVETENVTRVAAVPARLSASEVQERLSALPEWEQVGEVLLHERTFQDFVAAIAFVNRLVEPSEQLGHHPDITIRYNRVILKLTTHDAGGLTELDFQLAQQISQL